MAVLGSTFDGSYEPISEICAALDQLAAGGGPDVPVHVDGASGGFVAPFVQPDLGWDFRLPRVQSINASGHKYGLVYMFVSLGAEGYRAVQRGSSRVAQHIAREIAALGLLQAT